MDMFPRFWLGDLQLLESAKFFTPDRGFPQINLGVLYRLFFKGLKGYRFLDVSAIFLV